MEEKEEEVEKEVDYDEDEMMERWWLKEVDFVNGIASGLLIRKKARVCTEYIRVPWRVDGDADDRGYC